MSYNYYETSTQHLTSDGEKSWHWGKVVLSYLLIPLVLYLLIAFFILPGTRVAWEIALALILALLTGMLFEFGILIEVLLAFSHGIFSLLRREKTWKLGLLGISASLLVSAGPALLFYWLFF